MRVLSAAVVAGLAGVSNAFVVPVTPKTTNGAALRMSVKDDMQKFAAGTMAAVGVLTSFGGAAEALTKSELNSLTYLQVKGTGLANRCPSVVGEDKISISGSKQLVDLCIEPKDFKVEEEASNKKGDSKKTFVDTKLMTRETYTLDGISGTLSNQDGRIVFKEEDGIDYAATTVQLPGRERVPFLFTVKELVAKGSQPGTDLKPGFQLGGPFKVPSYRTGLFLDPKGRGMTTGYDMAVALPGLQNGVEGDSDLFKENNKTFDVTDGSIEFEIRNVNAEDGEVGGVFVSTQYSDTDLGSKTPKKVLIKGIFYGRVE